MSSQNRLAIRGGDPAVTLPAPAWPLSDEADAQRLLEVVRSGSWSWLGEHERAFCRAYADFLGTDYCLCMSNGTVSLQCALQAVGVEPGHEVIVPGLTWVATAQAALDVGADVVLVDIDPETLCLAPDAVRDAITARTKAILPVHVYGCMCDMDAIMSIAREHDLKVVEDAAHQHGSRWRGAAAGTIGDAGSFSFQQSKPLTSGEGGAMVCADPAVYETGFALKQVGWVPEDIGTDPFMEKARKPANRYGHNYRITEMQACLLRGGLARLPGQIAQREAAVAYLRERLTAMGGPLRLAHRDQRVSCQAYYCATLHVEAQQLGKATRDQYLQALGAEGIPLGVAYDPVYRNPLLNLYDRTSPVPYRDPGRIQDYAALRLPNAEHACTVSAAFLGHMHLLGSREYIDQLLDGIRKVNARLDAVAGLETSV